MWLLALAACAPPPSSPAGAQAIAEARAQIGRRYWFRSPAAELCTAPTSLRPCVAAPAAGFVVETVVADRFGSAWARLRFDDGKTGYARYVPGTARIAWASEDPRGPQSPAGRLAGLRARYCTGGQVQIGSDAAAALRAWCFPDRVVSHERAGRKREVWVYKRRGSLSFEDGRVTAIIRRE